jgi:hypothetical protein
LALQRVGASRFHRRSFSPCRIADRQPRGSSEAKANLTQSAPTIELFSGSSGAGATDGAFMPAQLW